MIDGMQMDAETVIVAPDLATLDLYCDGWPPPWDGSPCVPSATPRRPPTVWRTRSAARCNSPTSCAICRRTPNAGGSICRANGWMRRPCRTIRYAALRAPGLPRVCGRVAALAHEHFRAAHQSMRRCDAKAMKPARLMGATYAAILARLERRGWSRPDQRVSVPAWQKLWLALRYGLA